MDKNQSEVGIVKDQDDNSADRVREHYKLLCRTTFIRDLICAVKLSNLYKLWDKADKLQFLCRSLKNRVQINEN